jgi:putative selenate reductase molybdopterin-binding subunit
MTVTFHLNGVERTFPTSPGELLLDLLRREGFNGVRRGCSTGDCGNCGVILDGKMGNTCLVLASQVDGRKVETIEGLAAGGGLHPLQEAFLEHGAAQCGYCMSAMILSARCLLDKNPDPSERDVREAVDGVLCRCTGYKLPVEAVLSAAAKMRGDTP